jgi:hypothetical protein
MYWPGKNNITLHKFILDIHAKRQEKYFIIVSVKKGGIQTHIHVPNRRL